MDKIILNQNDVQEFTFDLSLISTLILSLSKNAHPDTSAGLSMKAVLSTRSAHPELVEGYERNLHFIIHKNAKLNLKITTSERTKADLNLKLDLVGEGAEVSVNGALLLKDSSDVKINVEQNHLSPNAISNVKIKTVLQDQTKFDYSGTIFIAKNAEQTVANQTNKNIVMSDEVVVKSIPNIEVLNKDVQCGHGSAIGKLDQDQILYLMSRGLSKTQAESILIKSFLNF